MNARTAGAGALLLTAFFGAAAYSNEVSLLETVQRTDVAVASLGGVRDFGYGDLTLSGVNGHPVTKAYLFWQGPERIQAGNPAPNATITMNGTAVTGQSIGITSDNCWGYAQSQAYRADVTNLVSGDGTYSLSNLTKANNAVNINGATLMVFFDDGNASGYRDYVLFNGNDSNIDNPLDAPGWDVNLPGVPYTGGQGFMHLGVSDGQPFPDAALVINGNIFVPQGEIFDGLTSQVGPNKSPYQELWDYKTFDITNTLSNGINTVHLTSGIDSDCLSLITAAIDLPAGTAPGNQIIPPPSTAGSPGVAGSAGGSNTISVTILAQGGAPAAGQDVTFTIISGPDAGISITATTAADGTASFTYTAAPQIATDVIEVRAGTAVTRIAVQLRDTTPPLIAFTASNDGSNGWFKTSPATLHVVATDNDGGGVASLSCTLDGAAVVLANATTSASTIAGDIASAVEGDHLVQCTASDPANNTASASTDLKLDSLAPVVSYTGDTGSYTVDQSINIACSATDPVPGSGLASNGCTDTSAAAYTFGVGTQTLTATALDNAGNVGTATATFSVQVTYPSLCNLNQQFVQGSAKYQALPASLQSQEQLVVGQVCGYVATAANSLNALQKARALAAYQFAVQTLASQGWLTSDQAAVLVALSNHL